MSEYNFKSKEERRRFYMSNIWRGVNGVRNQTVKRDGNECVWCKRDGKVTTSEMGALEVDHCIPLEECTYEQAIDLNNLRTLCRATIIIMLGTIVLMVLQTKKKLNGMMKNGEIYPLSL